MGLAGNIYAFDLRFQGELYGDLEEIQPTDQAVGDDIHIRWETRSDSCPLLKDVAYVELPRGYQKIPANSRIHLQSLGGHVYYWDHTLRGGASAIILLLPRDWTLSRNVMPPISCNADGPVRVSAKNYFGRIAILFIVQPSVFNLRTTWHMEKFEGPVSPEIQRINALPQSTKRPEHISTDMSSVPSKAGISDGPSGSGKTEVHGSEDSSNLLLQLGKLAGIGGIGVGTFFLLFRSLVFPKLGPTQANLFMLLIYGIGVIALIVWLVQTTTRRYLPVLLILFAAAMAGVGLSGVQPLHLAARSDDTTLYNVRVLVLDPSNTPTNNAHVWSTLGGEAKMVEGGWELALVPPTTDSERELKIFGQSDDPPSRGQARLMLGDNHSPRLTLQLERSGYLLVRGTVLNQQGSAVANAHVSVVGHEVEAVSTNAQGRFELPTHEEEGTTIQLHAERPPYAPVKAFHYKVGSGSVFLILNAAGTAKSSMSKLQPTGDTVIDGVLANLASLKQLKTPPTEYQLAETLAPLFSRPAFYGIREEDWRYFLYPLCRTRLLLEEYVNQFKTKAAVGNKITQAIQKMVILQNEVAAMYGPTFSVPEHISRYIDNQKAFIQNLPPVQKDPTPEFFNERDKEIQEIRQLLSDAGIPLKGP